MKNPSSEFLPEPLSVRSIVNSVTEDEDDYNNRMEWKENVRPNGDFRLPPLPPAPNSTFSATGVPGSTRIGLQNNMQPPVFNDGIYRTTMLPSPLREPIIDTQSYLTRYERMMNEQEIELSSTLSHLQSLFDLLEYLARPLDIYRHGQNVKSRVNLSKTFSIKELQRALDILEDQDGYETIKADKQFMMTLRTFCGKESKPAHSTHEQLHSQFEQTVSLGEFLQCYRMCIMGMQTLELLPAASSARNRTKERTLQMISLFRPLFPAKHEKFDVEVENSASNFSESTGKARRQQRPLTFILYVALAAGILAFAICWSLVDPSTMMFVGGKSQEFRPVKKVVHGPTSTTENKTDNFTAQKANLSIATPRISKRVSFNRKIAPPVITPIEMLRSKTTTRIQELESAPILSTGESIEIHSLIDITAIAAKDGSLLVPETVAKILGGAAVGLYLIAPLVSAGPSWQTLGVTFLVASLGGQTLREWVSKLKRTISKFKEQVVSPRNQAY
ncbi:hypothetical protein IV203_037557 [Nitzschia inconspicua]|uniref:Uncharacterized protein n=1 Tax=Nitzschia inconspicua TaxID=303405 RepID=A0A9K3LKZ1_9STRA|nr:hypothetical protein IV203_037557 [Nitzschia inconspicua]